MGMNKRILLRMVWFYMNCKSRKKGHATFSDEAFGDLVIRHELYIPHSRSSSRRFCGRNFATQRMINGDLTPKQPSARAFVTDGAQWINPDTPSAYTVT